MWKDMLLNAYLIVMVATLCNQWFKIRVYPPIVFMCWSSHCLFHNFSLRTQQLQNSYGSTDSKLPAYCPPPTTTSHSASPSSPHPWRKVQSVPCVRAQRPEWYCFISWYSPTVTQRHTLTHRAVQPGRFIQPTDLQRAPSVLGMTHKQHTVQQDP